MQVHSAWLVLVCRQFTAENEPSLHIWVKLQLVAEALPDPEQLGPGGGWGWGWFVCAQSS